MARYLLDTDILIDHERGFPKARDFLLSINRPQNQLFISVITLTELYAGLPPEMRNQSEPLISSFDIIMMDRPIAERAADLLHRYQKSAGLKIGDAVIAATALQLNASIATRNTKHFSFPNISHFAPYR